MYRLVTDIGGVREYLSGAKIIAFDFETAPGEPYRHEEKAALDPHKSHIAGVSFSVSEESGIYVPIAHQIGENADKTEIMAFLAEFAVDVNIIKVAHNLAFESMFLYKNGIVIKEPVYDTICAAQLSLKSHTVFRALADSGLKTLAPELLNATLPTFGEVVDGRLFDELDPQDTGTICYACADADYTLRLYHLFNNWFDRFLPKHRYITEQIESPAAVYVGLMKYNGIQVDSELMKRKAAECEKRLAELREEIAFIIGDINIGANASTSAFKNYLYKELGLPVLKTTAKYQEAADEECFVFLKEWCRGNRPELEKLMELVIDYRTLGKVYGTYIEGYLKHINDSTGRIHPQLLQLGADSGRFSCRQPNIQNQKSGSIDGINVRDFIIASEGNSLVEFDYSQIEARLAAYLSRDERLLNVYSSGDDLHAMTTAAVFKIPFAEAADRKNPDYKRRRTVAKTTFFGFLYGIYAKSLQRNLKLDAGINADIDECKAFLGNLAASYPTLTEWQKDAIAECREHRYAETVLGRRRYLPDIRSDNFLKQGSAERAALNHGVQGLAADLLKLSMVRLIAVLPPDVRPVFTVHDSLVFECPDGKAGETVLLIKSIMEIPPPVTGFDIPIAAEAGVGKSYGKMEELI